MRSESRRLERRDIKAEIDVHLFSLIEVTVPRICDKLPKGFHALGVINYRLQVHF